MEELKFSFLKIIREIMKNLYKFIIFLYSYISLLPTSEIVYGKDINGSYSEISLSYPQK